MREIANNLLRYIRESNSPDREGWKQYHYPDEVVAFIDYVYEGGIWDADHRGKLGDLQNMDAADMTLSDLYSYFTSIVCIERSYHGFVEQNAYDGTLEKLLKRYLELTKEEME